MPLTLDDTRGRISRDGRSGRTGGRSQATRRNGVAVGDDQAAVIQEERRNPPGRPPATRHWRFRTPEHKPQAVSAALRSPSRRWRWRPPWRGCCCRIDDRQVGNAAALVGLPCAVGPGIRVGMSVDVSARSAGSEPALRRPAPVATMSPLLSISSVASRWPGRTARRRCRTHRRLSMRVGRMSSPADPVARPHRWRKRSTGC